MGTGANGPNVQVTSGINFNLVNNQRIAGLEILEIFFLERKTDNVRYIRMNENALVRCQKSVQIRLSKR